MASSNIKPLTKKDLTEALGVQTRDFDKKLNDQTKELKSYTDEQTDALARIVNSAFEAQNEWLEQQFAAVRLDLDVRKRLESIRPEVPKARTCAKRQALIHDPPLQELQNRAHRVPGPRPGRAFHLLLRLWGQKPGFTPAAPDPRLPTRVPTSGKTTTPLSLDPIRRRVNKSLGAPLTFLVEVTLRG